MATIFLRLDSLKLGYCSGVSTDSKGNIYTSNDTKGLCKIDAKTLAVTTVVLNNYNDADPSNDPPRTGYGRCLRSGPGCAIIPPYNGMIRPRKSCIGTRFRRRLRVGMSTSMPAFLKMPDTHCGLFRRLVSIATIASMTNSFAS